MSESTANNTFNYWLPLLQELLPSSLLEQVKKTLLTMKLFKKRPAVLWRRTSFGTQSQVGSTFVARMLTVVTTLRSQQRNIIYPPERILNTIIYLTMII